MKTNPKAFTPEELHVAIIANTCQMLGATNFAAAIVELLKQRSP